RRLAVPPGAPGPTFRIEGVDCPDEETLLRFAPEIEAARGDGLLARGETVIAGAWGGSGGSFLPGAAGTSRRPRVPPRRKAARPCRRERPARRFGSRAWTARMRRPFCASRRRSKQPAATASWRAVRP